MSQVASWGCSVDIVMPARGDWGAIITFSMKKKDGTVLDLSTASSVKAWFTKPDGSTTSIDGTVSGDGSTGQFTVLIAASTVLNLTGVYIVEPQVVFPNADFVGTPFKFTARSTART